MPNKDQIAQAIRDVFVSPNVPDSNFEAAGLVDVVNYVANGLFKLSRAITADASPGRTSDGGHVECLTEAVMGVEKSLSSIADALNNIAEAIREDRS